MRKKLISAALIFGLFSFQTPAAFATFPVVSLPVPQTAKFDQGMATLKPPTSNSPGAIVYAGLNHLNVSEAITAIAAGFVIVLVRELSIKFDWHLPKI